MFKKIHQIISSQYGIDLYRLFRGIVRTKSYIADYVKLRKVYNGKVIFDPWLHDKLQSAGATENEYFWQDLFVANLIYINNPIKHADVGSRIDGFVAHLATSRQIEVFDIRKNTEEITNVTFNQADLINFDISRLTLKLNQYDSLSCLHALEHFGLGRYGDPINIQGPEIGIANMTKLLKKNGLFYLSVPVGKEHIQFNANWIFDPNRIIEIALKSNLRLTTLYKLFPNSKPIKLTINEDILMELASNKYTLCLFIFCKI